MSGRSARASHYGSWPGCGRSPSTVTTSPPRQSGLALSAAGLLAYCLISLDAAAGQVLAVATVAGLLTVGVITRRVLMIVIGAIGVTYVVPDTTSRYLPGSVGPPLAVAVVGLILLGIALWLARTRRSAGGNARAGT